MAYKHGSYSAVVMGGSAGGIEALKCILPPLSEAFPLPMAIVQHRDQRSGGFLAEYLSRICALPVKEADDKEPFSPGGIYLAPAGYHLLIEPDGTFSLSVDGRVNYSCPSIDVLFESAADVYGPSLIGVVLTGANADGSHGLKCIKDRGGMAIVQDPETAESPAMPRAALAATQADYVVAADKIAPLLMALATESRRADSHGTSR